MDRKINIHRYQLESTMATSVKYNFFIRAKISAEKFPLTSKWNPPDFKGQLSSLSKKKSRLGKKTPQQNTTTTKPNCVHIQIYQLCLYYQVLNAALPDFK